jgi:membrane protein
VLTYRASAIAYNFFLALIPTLLFLVTLIPFITTPDFQANLFDLLDDVIPSGIFDLLEGTIKEIISRPRNDLLSISFLVALYFSTNGIDAVMESFNHGYYKTKKRSWWHQKIIAFFLLLTITVLGLISVVLLMFGKVFITILEHIEHLREGFVIVLLQFLQWIIIVGNILLSMSLLYYFGQRKDKNRKYCFFSPGSVFSTTLFVVGGILLRLYFENITRYNILYGSFGSLMVFLIWIYYNALIILIGFELNSAVRRLKLLEDKRKNKEL